MDPTADKPTTMASTSESAPSDASERQSPEELRKAIDQHAGTLYRVALAVVGDPSLADDVVQETMIKAWRSGPIDAGGAIPRPWLIKVARNTAISVLRRRREDSYDPEQLPEVVSPSRASARAEGREALGHLAEAMKRLPEADRALIVLREIEGLSYDEIAETMDLTLSVVKTRLFRARKTLKQAMEEWR